MVINAYNKDNERVVPCFIIFIFHCHKRYFKSDFIYYFNNITADRPLKHYIIVVPIINIKPYVNSLQ